MDDILPYLIINDDDSPIGIVWARYEFGAQLQAEELADDDTVTVRLMPTHDELFVD